MRLRRLDLTRYGKFTDRSIDFGPHIAGQPDLHIVYGLNEAGKSTTFSSYLDLLFGMPSSSSYNFLHAYNVMQVGARLEIDGSEHELVRLKQRSGSLVDGRGQVVHEALLAGALGGMTRETYQSMFSLDDHSLEDGGRAIIQSKGELGELLFSASSGLAGLAQALASASDEAQQIFRRRAPSTRIAEMKRRLASLKAARDEIDTFAAGHAQLTATFGQAERAYQTTMAELAEAKAKQKDIERWQSAWPPARERARIAAEIAARGSPPRPPSEWFALLPELSRDETRLFALRDSAAQSIAALEAEIDRIDIDHRLMGLSARIRALADARYRTAEEDLPKRRAALAEQNAVLAQRLTELGRPGEADPGRLLLPASLTGQLRQLIETRSGIDAAMAAARRECDRAEQALARLRAEIVPAGQTDQAARDAALTRMATLCAEIRGADLLGRYSLETRAVRQARHALTLALAELKPWQGTEDALRQLAAADGRQIEAWRGQASALERRIDSAREKLRELVTAKGQCEARLAAAQSGMPFDDDAAGQLRAERDRAWLDHFTTLDRQSAEAFEILLRRDDALSERRLSHAHELIELRQTRQSLATVLVDIDRQQALLAEVLDERSTLVRRMAACLPIPPSANAQPDDLLPLVERWCDGRARALAAAADCAAADDRLAAIGEDMAGAAQQLQAAIAVAGLGETGAATNGAAGLTEIFAEANEILAGADRRKAALAAEAKALATADRDLRDRQADLTAAEAGLAQWQGEWDQALAESWFGSGVTATGAISAILNVLADLPSILRERDQLAQRVMLMERDQAEFRREIDEIAVELGEDRLGRDPLVASAELSLRLEAGLLARQSLADKQHALERRMEEWQVLEEKIRIHSARRAELIDFFGVDSLAGVSRYLDEVREAERLEERCRDLERQVCDIVQVASFDDAERLLADMDAEALARQSEEWSLRVDDLTERTRHLFADMSRARDQLDGVGGDDAVARIESERRTVLLDIEELAGRYLTLRTGVLAAERGLQIYREKHRSQMMKRASEAFSAMTGGQYSGLAARAEKDREILIGLTREGGSKHTDNMSTGTRFQLYLALRLAGYEEFAAVRPSVPFIADDIMESFDNPRSEAVFRLLGQMAGVGQVIYLTHHWHLCEIAQQAVPSVRIHHL